MIVVRLCFLDTPGFHQPKDALSSMMVKATVATLKRSGFNLIYD
jgi:GTPase Era involved in 16S rRNA processing